jgi:hypothetical protein
MSTVPATSTKVNRAYFAFLDDTHGILTKIAHVMYFMSDAGDITEIEPQHCAFLMPLGEVGLAETQALMDRLHGGAAWIASHRQMEVA